MVSHAVPLVAMATMSAYVGILFAGLYFALTGLTNAEERRDYLSFSLTCAAVVAFDLFTARLYVCRSFAEGIVWNRISLCMAVLLGVVYMTFVWDFLKRPLPLPLRIVRGAMVVVSLPIAVWDSEYTQSSQHPAIKFVSALGSNIVYYEADNGVLTTLMYVAFVVVYAAATLSMVSHFRSPAGRAQRGRWAFFVGTMLSGVTVSNDVLVGSQVYRFVYLAEYGFTCTILSMGYVLLMRFADLRGRINMLNQSLSHTNDELVLALERANESIRLKSEFLASISHELRTPLNAIINLPEAVLEQFGRARTAICVDCGAEFAVEPEEQLGPESRCEMCGQGALRESLRPVFDGHLDETQTRLNIVVRAGKHLLTLVNDLLNASKLELGRTKLEMSSFDCADLLAEVIGAVQTNADPRGIVICQHPAACVSTTLVADRVRVGQVLYNILSNAIKFSHDRGRIDVTLRCDAREHLLICIRDHGIGIASEHHALVFEKFRQVESGGTRTYGGTGLGLAISKGLVELHRGRIWVDSKVGEGAAFYVELPRNVGEVDDVVDGASLERKSA